MFHQIRSQYSLPSKFADCNLAASKTTQNFQYISLPSEVKVRIINYPYHKKYKHMI